MSLGEDPPQGNFDETAFRKKKLKRYYAEIGEPQNMSLREDPPQDNFDETALGKKKLKWLPERTNEKIYTEVMLNGGHINKNMQQ